MRDWWEPLVLSSKTHNANNMNKKFFPLFFLHAFFLSIFISLAHAEVPIQIKADTVEYSHERQKAVGTGHASVDYEGARLTADKITVYTATKQAVAENHVTLIQKGSVFTGDYGEYNFGTKVGNVSRMNADIPPNYYGKAQKVEKVSEDHYRLTNSYLTTCCGDDPLYKIQSSQVDIYPEEKVVVRNALLLVKGIPVLFLPYYEQYFLDYNHPPVQVLAGKNSEWGAFLLSRWRYNLGNSPAFQSKGNVLLDYRVKRGVGSGVENFYKGKQIGRGSFKYYYINDEKPPAGEIPERYRVQWREQAKLAPHTTLTTEWNKLSDPTIVKDFFFREEYERDVFPDNYISIITARPEYTLSILARERLDDFFTVVERNPEVRFDTHNRQLFDLPFYLREEGQFSNLKKEFADSSYDIDVTRFDSNHTLSYAGHLGHVSVVPRIGTRQTFYSRVVAGDDPTLRSTVDPGLDVSTKFYKVYDTYIDAFGLDYNRIRHIFTPTASYNFRPNPTVLRTEFDQFDSLDALDKQNFIRFNFENKLQTKQHSSRGANTLYTRDLARVIPFCDFNFDTNRMENVGVDTELHPYTWLGIGSHINYDTILREVDIESTDISFRGDKLGVSFGQSYVRGFSHQLSTSLGWRITPEWGLLIYERQELRQAVKGLQEFEGTLSRTFNCVIVDFTYNHRLQHGDTFFIVVRLKAFPNLPFKFTQSYNSPRTLSTTTKT